MPWFVLGESLLRRLLRDQNVIRSGITAYLAVTVMSYVLDCSAALLTRPVDHPIRVRLFCAPFLGKIFRGQTCRSRILSVVNSALKASTSLGQDLRLMAFTASQYSPLFDSETRRPPNSGLICIMKSNTASVPYRRLCLLWLQTIRSKCRYDHVPRSRGASDKCSGMLKSGN